MKTGSAYKDGFLAIVEDYRQILARDGMDFLNRVANEKSVRHVLLTVYDILRDAGRLVPIEQLPAWEKQALWTEACGRCRELSQQARVECCRALHALGTWCLIKDEEP